MIEMIAKLSATMKTSILPIFMFTVFYKNKEATNTRLNKNDFSDDEIPGDNFPYIAMNGHNLS